MAVTVRRLPPNLCTRTPGAVAAAGKLEQGQIGMLGDEAADEGMSRRWGPLIVAALGYVAVGAWDWTDTVEDLAR